MHSDGFFYQALVYLTAAVISVPIAKRLGLGSVLGYLLAGIAIGPFALGLIGSEGQDVMHFAEFGVVMMLFLIGLELQPNLLWRLRIPILGLGGLQVLITTGIIFGITLYNGYHWQTSLAIGMILSLSSTAIVLQTLTEKGLIKTDGGQNAFSVLLFQDVAVIPMLAVLPLLVAPIGNSGVHSIETGVVQATTWVQNLPVWQQTLVVLASMALIIVAGRYATIPIFRFIAISDDCCRRDELQFGIGDQQCVATARNTSLVRVRYGSDAVVINADGCCVRRLVRFSRQLLLDRKIHYYGMIFVDGSKT